MGSRRTLHGTASSFRASGRQRYAANHQHRSTQRITNAQVSADSSEATIVAKAPAVMFPSEYSRTFVKFDVDIDSGDDSIKCCTYCEARRIVAGS